MTVLKASYLGVFLTSSAFALSTVSGSLKDMSGAPVDGAAITVWRAESKTGVRTSSSMGSFSLSDLAEGDYLFKVEKDNTPSVLGAFHLGADETRQIGVITLSASLALQGKDAVGAASVLRESPRTARDLTKPPKFRAAKLKKMVTPAYPSAERKARIEGVVKIAIVILPNGAVAVSRWLYSPTYADDQPVEVSLTVDVVFQHS